MRLHCPQPFTPALGAALVCLACPAYGEDYSFKPFCNGNPVGDEPVQVHHGDAETAEPRMVVGAR